MKSGGSPTQRRDNHAEWAESVATTKALVAAEATTVFSQFFNKWVRVLRVGKAITSDYRTISDALAHSKPLDRIEVEVGTYYETIAISHSVELTTADNGDDAVITTRGPCITISTDQPVMISRLAVTGRGQRPSDCVAVLISRGSPVIQDCLLSSVHVAGVATPTVTHCTIENSEAGCGLRLTDHCGGEYKYNDIRFHRCECVKIACAGRPVFRKNRIYQKNANATLVNIAGGRYGTECAPILDENLISGTEHFAMVNAMQDTGPGTLFDRPTQLLNRNLTVPDGLIAVSWGASPSICNNTLVSGAVGVHLEDCYMPEGYFENNRIISCSAWGMYLGPNAVAHICGNEFTGNAGGIRTQATDAVILDCRFHHNEYFGIMAFRCPTTMIKNTIDQSEVGLVVLHNCCDMRFEENVVRQSAVAGAHIIADGICTLENNIFVSNRGVGILISDNSNVTLLNNNCKENDTNIMIRGQSYLHAHHNQLFQPSAHNVIFMEASSGILEYNDISEAPTLAHVAVVQKSRPIIRHNFIRAGASSGILVESRATPFITSNQISSLREAIRVRQRGDPIVMGNEFQSCTDGLVCEEFGTCLFTENTLRAMGHAFVISKSGGHPSVRNNDCRTSARFGFCIEDGGRGDFEKNVLRDSSLCGCYVSGPLSFANVRGNRFLGAAGGVSVERLAKADVISNTFTDMINYGLRVMEQAVPLMASNCVYSSDGYGILGLDGSGSIKRNTVQGCKIAGIRAADGCCSTFESNMVCDNVKDGIMVSKGARCSFTNDTSERNGGCGIVVEGDAQATELKSLNIWKNHSHGVKVAAGGSCVFEACTITENEGDGVFLAEAGDVLLSDCSISTHRRCVVCRDEGQATMERCTIFDASGDTAVYVMQDGQLKLNHCIVESCATNGVRVSCRGHVWMTECTVRNCKVAGLEVTCDAAITLVQTELLACDVGVNFVSMTPAAELKETTIEKPAPTRTRRRSSAANAPQTSPGVGFIKPGQPLSSATPSTPTSPLIEFSQDSTDSADALMSKSRRGIGLPHVSVVLSPDDEGPTLPPPKPVHPSTMQRCKVQANRVGIQCPADGMGTVSRSELEENEVGILICSDSNVVFDAVTCIKSTHYGLVVDGAPGPQCTVTGCKFLQCRGVGGILRNSTNPDFLIASCLFEGNLGGGLVLLASRCVVRDTTVQQHDTFGSWHAQGDGTTFERAYFDANKENNVIVLEGSCPVFVNSTIRNSEHGIAVLQVASAFILRDSTLSLNRIGIALYLEVAALDRREALQDSDWNDRYRGGGSRRRSSVAVIMSRMEGADQFVTTATKQATPVTKESDGDLLSVRKRSFAKRKESSSSSGSQPTSSHQLLPSAPNRTKEKIISIAAPDDRGHQNKSPFLMPRSPGSAIASSSTPTKPAGATGPKAVARVERCVMDQNSVAVDHASQSCELEITDTRFTNCLTNGCLVQRLATLRMSQCHISGSSSGVLLKQESRATLTSVVAQNNRTGIFIEGNASAWISKCTILENVHGGIFACDRAVLVNISECHFRKNGRGGGVQVSSGSILTVSQNDFSEEAFGVKIDEQSSPRILSNTFTDCGVGIEVSGSRCSPKLCFNNFQGGNVGLYLDEKCTPAVYRNIFQRLAQAGIEIRHYADPTVAQNIFEDCLGKDATGVVVESNGAGVLGNNRFFNNYNGIRAGCNAETFVTMLNAFEKHGNAAAVFLEAASGHFSRNQCLLNSNCDVMITGGPAMAGLVVDRNAFVVSGTGVSVEGSSMNATTIRQNRFFGSGGIGVALGTQCNATVAECLFHALNSGVQFCEGSTGTCETSLIVGCGVGVRCLPASEGIVRDTTILSSTTHSLHTLSESKVVVTNSRLGQSFGSVSSVMLSGGGEVSNSLIFASLAASVTCGAGCTATVQRNIIQQGKCGVQFAPDCNPSVRTNVVTRNDLGVNISVGSGGQLTGNSCFSNVKAAIQINTPHKVLIGKNFFAQDNDSNPSILGLIGAELAAAAKANNAVGHGGRAEGGEKFIVPITVTKAVASETVLLNQFHQFLTGVGAPPTDALSAAIDSAAIAGEVVETAASGGDGGGSGFHYASLIASSAAKATHEHVVAAQERILDIGADIAGDEIIQKVLTAASKSSAHQQSGGAVALQLTMKRLNQVNWDLKRPLVSLRTKAKSFKWDRYDDFGGDDEPESDTSDADSLVYTSGSDSDWDYERMPDGSKRKRRRRGGFGTNQQMTPGGTKARAKGRRTTRMQSVTKTPAQRRKRSTTTGAGGDSSVTPSSQGISSQPDPHLPDGIGLVGEAFAVAPEDIAGREAAILLDPPPLDLESPLPDDGGLAKKSVDLSANETTSAIALVEVSEPSGCEAGATELEREESKGNQSRSDVLLTNFITMEQVADKSLKRSARSRNPSEARGAKGTSPSKDPSGRNVRGKKGGRGKSPETAGGDRKGGALPRTKSSIKHQPSFMRPVSREQRPVTVPEEPKLGSARSMRLRPSPPPASPVATEEERLADAAKRLEAYQAVWVVMKNRQTRSRSLASTQVAALAAVSLSHQVKGMDAITLARQRRARSLPAGRLLDNLFAGLSDEAQGLPIMVTDEYGNDIPFHRIGAASEDADIAGIVLIGRDEAKEAECMRETVLWLAEGHFTPLSEPLEVLRGMVLRRIQLLALATDQTRFSDVIVSIFDKIISRGSRIVIDQDRAAWEEANRLREEEAAKENADLLLLGGSMRPSAGEGPQHPRTPLSPPGAGGLRVVGKASQNRSQAMSVFEGLLADPANQYPSGDGDPGKDGSSAAAWMDNQVRKAARRTDRQWLEAVGDQRDRILRLVIPSPIASKPSSSNDGVLVADRGWTVVDPTALHEPRESELAIRGNPAAERKWQGGGAPPSASSRSTGAGSRIAGAFQTKLPAETALMPSTYSGKLPHHGGFGGNVSPPPLPLNDAYPVHLPRIAVVLPSQPSAPVVLSPPSRMLSRASAMVEPPSTPTPVARQFHTTRLRATPQLLVGASSNSAGRATPRSFNRELVGPSQASALLISPRAPSSNSGVAFVSRTPTAPLATKVALKHPHLLRKSCVMTCPEGDALRDVGVGDATQLSFDASRPRETSPYFMRIDPIEPLPLLAREEEVSCGDYDGGSDSSP